MMIGISCFCILIILLGIVSFSKSITAPIRRKAASIIPAKALATIENIREGVYQYRHKKKEMFFTLILTLFIQLILVLNASLLIKGISGRFFFWECLAFMPIIEIASMSVPITPSGMGIRETLIALMFKHVGLSNEQLGIYIFIVFSANSLRLVGAIPVFFNHGIQKRSIEMPDDGH